MSFSSRLIFGDGNVLALLHTRKNRLETFELASMRHRSLQAPSPLQQIVRHTRPNQISCSSIRSSVQLPNSNPLLRSPYTQDPLSNSIQSVSLSRRDLVGYYQSSAGLVRGSLQYPGALLSVMRHSTSHPTGTESRPH